MKHHPVLACIIVSVVAAGAAFVASGCGGAKVEYATFEDPQKTFAVQIPAQLEMKETRRWQEDLTLDTRVTCIQYQAVSDEVTYSVRVIFFRVGDFLPGATPDSRARDMVEAGLKTAGFTLEKTVALQRGGIPVMRATGEMLKEGQRLVGIAESYVLKAQSLLLVAVALKDAAEDDPSVAHFFESFRALGIPLGP